jgi:heme o synthase
LFIGLALQLIMSRMLGQRAAHRLFAFSIFYLFLLFAALLADRPSHPRSSRLSSSPIESAVGSSEDQIHHMQVAYLLPGFRISEP